MRNETVFIVGMAVMLLFAACVSEEKLTAEQILERSTIASANVSSYTFQVDVMMHLVDSESLMLGGENVVEMSWTGEADMKNERMHMDMGVASQGVSMDMEQYIIGDTQYISIPFFGWVKNRTRADFWSGRQDLITPFDAQSVFNATLAGEEEVDGVDCYVLDVKTGPEQLFAFFGEQTQSSGLSLEEIDSIKRMEFREWIGKDNFLLKKTYTSVEMVSSESSLEMNLTMVFDDYNEPVEIILPAEAEQAFDIEGLPLG